MPPLGESNAVVHGDRYTLTFATDRPFVYLDDAEGRRIAELFALSSIHPRDGRDDTTTISPWRRDESPTETTVSLEAGSAAWARKTYTFHCRPDRFTYECRVDGHGLLAEAQLFGGYYSAQPRWGSGFFWSGQHCARGFTPEPNAEEIDFFPATGSAVIDIAGVPLPGKRHWFFTPPPFFFALEAAHGWVGLGVEARPGAHSFTEYAYHGGLGFYLSLSYEGYARVDGTYTLPAIGFDFAPTPYEALDAHCQAARTALTPRPPLPSQGEGETPAMVCTSVSPRSFQRSEDAYDRTEGENSSPSLAGRERALGGEVTPSWWREPIFCGWGAQCDLAAREHGYVAHTPRDASFRAYLAALKHAPGYSTQDRYDGFLRALAAHNVAPGTVVLDDKWQATYGDNRVDENKWSDLRGFIDARHAAGQRVLLWLKAWDPEGAPDKECVRNGAGLPLAVDPTNPAYERRLRDAVRRMLARDEGSYDADGFKIDFTARIPSGPGHYRHGAAWGLELLHLLLHIIHDEAKRTKSDALIMTHTPHPYLADTLDMIRLNDMIDLSRYDDPAAMQHIAAALDQRARVARAACPHALVDTDNWPVTTRAVWREYVRLQPRFGVPSLYVATHLDISQEPLTEEDYGLVRDTWARYRATLLEEIVS